MAGERAGTEPRTARSPLRLRLVMSAVMLALIVVAAVLLGVAASGADGDRRTGLLIATAMCAAVGVIALVDLARVIYRLDRGDHG